MRLLHVSLLALIAQYTYVTASNDVASTSRKGPVAPSTGRPVLHSTFSITAGSSAVVSLNDSSSAVSCNASWVAWLSSSVAFSVGSYMTFTSTRTYHNMTAQIEVLCDGHTRIVGGLDGLTTTATGTSTFLTSAVLTPSGQFKPPAPTCVPNPSDRTSMFLRFGVWVPMTEPFGSIQAVSTLPSSLAGHGQICGHCNLYGGTVQLLYFPITGRSSHIQCPTNSPGSPTLCPLASTLHSYHVTNPYEMSPCAYVTPNTTSTRNSGPYFVSAGQTFYQNRAYISLQTVYAKDDCSFVGTARPGTVLEVMSTDVYSVGGYHHQFQDVGYRVNFQDFTSVPAAAYYMFCNVSSAEATYCSYTGSRYRYSTDFINGMNTIDFGNVYQPYSTKNQWIWDEAYAPRLLVPLQMRQLDSAWSTCSWNLNGLYDPPHVLSAELTYPTPTNPSTPNTASARPASSPSGQQVSQTAKPIITPPTTFNVPADPGSPSALPSPHLPTHALSNHPASNSQDPQPSPGGDPAGSNSASPAGAPHESSQEHETVTFTADQHVHTIIAVPTTTGVYVIDGEYIVTEGAPAVTVDGMRVSVGSGDILRFGSKYIDLSGDESVPAVSATSKPPSVTLPLPTRESSIGISSAAPTTSGGSIRAAWAKDSFLVWLIPLLAALASQ